MHSTVSNIESVTQAPVPLDVLLKVYCYAWYNMQKLYICK